MSLLAMFTLFFFFFKYNLIEYFTILKLAKKYKFEANYANTRKFKVIK